jgi:signal transduction histidine kinase/signal recognition particle receptor subunit beta
MGFINVAERTINAKLVYYGVGVGGKTTSLQQVHGIFCPRNEVQLVSINTEEESTLLFDFLPINLGTVGGFKIRIQGFTVPGQPKYKQMRKYVLQGADAVVFVVDSQRSRLEENVESLQSMREHLREQPGTSEDIPIVAQYNKRDLDDILTERELDQHFCFRDDVTSFPSVATEGHGVFEAFVEATCALVERKVELYGLTDEECAPSEVAEGVRQKLWAICDEVRRAREVVPVDELPQTRLLQGEDRPQQPADPVPDDVLDLPADDGGDDLAETVELRDMAPVRGPADEVQLDDGDEESFDFGYELRESAESARAPDDVQNGDEVLSDEELDLDLSAGVVDFEEAPVEESEPELLDKTVQSNLELAERYGELDEKRLQLERKLHELVDVAQCTVHDLNRPISALRLMLSTLDKGYLGELSEPQGQAIENGLMAVHQMERLVRDLLDSSRLDHDGVRLEFTECDLTLLVADVLRTLRYELDEYSLLVRVEPLPVTRVDQWALTKALMNLIGNAIAYRSSDRTPLVRVFAEDRGEHWALAVSDNGIGIPEADRERLFRRFERGSNTSGISGTGLGLHIVKEIVQGHGGTVAFDSEVGHGTTFWLNLPKQPVLAPHSPISDVGERVGL